MKKHFATSSEWSSLDRKSSFRLHYPGLSSTPPAFPVQSDLPVAITPTQKTQRGAMPYEHPKDPGQGWFQPKNSTEIALCKDDHHFAPGKAKVLSMGLNELQGLPSLTSTVWETTGSRSIAQSAWELSLLIKGGHRLRTAGKCCQRSRERERQVWAFTSRAFICLLI